MLFHITFIKPISTIWILWQGLFKIPVGTEEKKNTLELNLSLSLRKHFLPLWWWEIINIWKARTSRLKVNSAILTKILQCGMNIDSQLHRVMNDECVPCLYFWEVSCSCVAPSSSAPSWICHRCRGQERVKRSTKVVTLYMFFNEELLYQSQLSAPLCVSVRGERRVGDLLRKPRHYFADALGKEKINDESTLQIDTDWPAEFHH